GCHPAHRAGMTMGQYQPEPPADPTGSGPSQSSPSQPAPGELPYDVYPAPSGGVFEQASHESIAPMPDAPAYQVPPPGPGETTPYGQPPGHSLGHSPASTPADYQLPPDPLGGDAGTHSYGIDPQYQPQPQQQ